MKSIFTIEKQLIALFLVSIVVISNTESASVSCKCTDLDNTFYKVKITKYGYLPYYSFLTLLPNGIFIETVNIANGNNAAQIGFNVEFNVHTGTYECLTGNQVRFLTTGFIYKSNVSEVLKDNGAIGVHEYDVQFGNNKKQKGSGTFRFSFYDVDSDPFNKKNTPVLISPTFDITCQLLNGLGVILPTSGS